jgi:hypothetical protein
MQGRIPWCTYSFEGLGTSIHHGLAALTSNRVPTEELS